MLAGLALVTPRRDKIPVPPSLPSGVKPFLPEQKSDHDNRKIDSD
jgi:hypothetical protein